MTLCALPHSLQQQQQQQLLHGSTKTVEGPWQKVLRQVMQCGPGCQWRPRPVACQYRTASRRGLCKHRDDADGQVVCWLYFSLCTYTHVLETLRQSNCQSCSVLLHTCRHGHGHGYGGGGYGGGYGSAPPAYYGGDTTIVNNYYVTDDNGGDGAYQVCGGGFTLCGRGYRGVGVLLQQPFACCGAWCLLLLR